MFSAKAHPKDVKKKNANAINMGFLRPKRSNSGPLKN